MAGISIDDMAVDIMDGLQEESERTDTAMKKALQKTASQVRKEISENAPKRTGKYGKSWTTKKTAEKSQSLQIVVHSKNRYQIAHLLEHGHAKRNGGRVEAQPHIAPAEEHGAENFDELLKKYLS